MSLCVYIITHYTVIVADGLWVSRAVSEGAKGMVVVEERDADEDRDGGMRTMKWALDNTASM